ncbi:MAG: hypothetical protein FJW35_07270 [Acidobacteria bacterium]|nr:hypothetical protein [Acidobacteriota bacterium]
MKRIASFLVPLAALYVLTLPAAAQTQYRFEVFAGMTFPLDKDFEIGYPQASPPMQMTQEFSPGARGGVRLGVDGTGHWGMDLSYGYGANAAKVVNRTYNADFAFTPRIHQAAWNLLWYPGGLSVRPGTFPYLTAGIGGTIHTVTRGAVNQALDPAMAGIGRLRSVNTFAFNAGGGVRMRLRDRYGIRFDIRDYMTKGISWGLPKSSDDPNAVVFPAVGLQHQFEVSFAFIYYF